MLALPSDMLIITNAATKLFNKFPRKTTYSKMKSLFGVV